MEIIFKVFISRINLNYQILNVLRKKKIKYEFINSFNFNKKFKNKNFLLGILAGFPLILKKNQLNTTKLGFINLHAGKLPDYRGGSPLNWQIINNEKYFHISIIKATEKIDCGEIIETKKFKLLNKYNINDLHRIANKGFKNSVKKVINYVNQNNHLPPLKKQNDKKSFYWPQREKRDSFINLKTSNKKDLINLIRASSKPYNGAYFFYNNYKYIVYKASIIKFNKKMNSKILMKKSRLIFKCKNGYIKLINFKKLIIK